MRLHPRKYAHNVSATCPQGVQDLVESGQPPRALGLQYKIVLQGAFRRGTCFLVVGKINPSHPVADHKHKTPASTRAANRVSSSAWLTSPHLQPKSRCFCRRGWPHELIVVMVAQVGVRVGECQKYCYGAKSLM